MPRLTGTVRVPLLSWLVALMLFVVACSSGESAGTGMEGSNGQGGSTSAGGAQAGGAGGLTGGGGSATGGATASGGASGLGGSGGRTTGAGGSGMGGVRGSGGSAMGGSTGAGGAGSGTCGSGSATAGDVSVSLSNLQQKISGFGVSTAWGSSMSAADAAMLWSTSTGAGLSLHRVRIDYTNGHTSELNIAKMAVSYGVTVWATPWTPPVADKSNNNAVEGTMTNPTAYATFLVGFVNYMKQNGVNIYAVSAQNEPDANVTYESCVYTPATMAQWVGGALGPAFAGSGVKVMAPETQNWCGFPSFEAAIMSDANAKKYTDIVATHEYGCSPKAYPDIAAAGKEFWETEIFDASATGDNSMSSPLRIAKLINDAMTIANVNAWHYWWAYSSTSGLFTALNAPTKRLWVEGNYARFVRPGYQRVGTSGSAPSGVLLSAYTNPADGTVVVVAVNNNSASTPISFYVSGAAPCSVTPWITDAANDLAAKTAITVAGGRFSATLGGQSVTTFVGRP